LSVGDEVAIRVEEISKRFALGTRSGYRTLRESVARAIRSPGRAFRGNATEAADPNWIWALRDVSFEVPRGQVTGILGGNGAGKSTLLKILSRITEPTSGRAELNGRVASLLEVGTGFHPELTGRENVYLNGAILGMKKAEVEVRYDEIVAFAGVERFLETPVKRYSSGMRVRLAFAVAAHLESEILIVDEVLAVGDAEFQRKCLGKMNAIAGDGRTVLFVSHNTALLQNLCERGLLLTNGELRMDAPIREAVTAYLRNIEARATVDLSLRRDRGGSGDTRLHAVEIFRADRGRDHTPAPGSRVRFVFHVKDPPGPWDLQFTIYDERGFPVSSLDSRLQGNADIRVERGGSSLVCEVDELLLVPGRYRVNTALFARGQLQDHLEGAAIFEVCDGTFDGRPVEGKRGSGIVLLRHRWVPGGGSGGGAA